MHARKQVATVIRKVAAAASLSAALLLLQALPAVAGPASHDPWKIEEVRVGGSTVVNATGRCEACHTLDPDAGENGTSYISTTARTLGMMKLAKGGAFTLSENFGCTFCHSARLDNATMDDVLTDFDSPMVKHPVGRLVDGTTNTHNEYLSTYGGAPLANELQCNQCHNTTLLTYPSHEGRSAGDPAAWAGTWDKTANPNALLNVTVAADAEKNHCVSTCHGDLGAGNGATKPKMGHYGWGGYDGTSIFDPTGQALQAGATSTCTVCHDTHTSTKAGLMQDGLDRGQPDAGRTAINENTCVAVCHAAGQFDLYGHGGKVGISSIMCTPCHTTAVSHRDTTDEASVRRMVYVDPVKGNLTMSLAADGLDNDMDGVLDAADADEATFAYSKTSNCKTCHMHYAGHGSATRAAACMDCHDPHGDAAVGNAAMIRTSLYGEPVSFTAAERAAGTFYRTGFTNGVCDNDSCHSNIAGGLSTAHKGGTGAVLAQPCTDCHNMTHTDPQVEDTDSGFLVTQCTGCHTAVADTDNWNITDTTPAKVSSTEWTSAGHGRTTAYPSGNPAGNFSGPASDANGCAYCHSFGSSHGDATNPFRLANKGAVGTEADKWNQVCLVCHKGGDAGYDPDGGATAYGSRNGTANVDDNHYGGKHTVGTRGGAFCWDCHDPHGDTQHYMVHSGDGSAAGRGVTALSDGTYGIPSSSRTVQNLDVSAGGYTSADLINGTGTGLCQTCHAAAGAGASYFYRGAAPPASASHNNYDTNLCTSCHLHSNDFAPSCTDCHGDVAGMAVPRGDGSSYPPEGPVVARSSGQGGTVDWAESTSNAATVGHHEQHVGSYGLGSCASCHTAGPGTDAAHMTNKLNATMTGIAAYGTWAQGTAVGNVSVVDDTCTNMSCHNSTYSANAYRSAANPGYVRYWDSNLDCYSCHAFDGSNSAIRPGVETDDVIGTGSHADHVAGYAMGCAECHVDPAGNLAHKNGSVGFAVNLGATRLGAALGGHYDANGVAPWDAAPVPSEATQQRLCADAYCHSTGEPRGIAPLVYRATTKWGDGTTGACGTCHGVDGVLGTMATNVHGTHVGSAAGQYALACATCHSSVADATPAITSTALHVNNQNNVAFAAGEGSYGSVAGDCTATYCHSRGLDWSPAFVQGVNAPQTTPDWDTGTAGCNYCHGDGSVAYPNYANDLSVTPGAVAQTKKNSHAAHTGYTCSICHGATVDGSNNVIAPGLHTNKAWDLAAGGTETFTVTVQGEIAGDTYTATRCTNISCHGGAGTVADWGQELSCTSCHGRPAAGGGDLNDWVYDNGTMARVNTDEWTATGHGRTTAYPPAAGGNVAAAFAGPAGDPNGCAYCHSFLGTTENPAVLHGAGANPFRLANRSATQNAANGWGWNEVCLVCHSSTDANGYDPDGLTTAYNPENGSDVNENHYGGKHADLEGGQYCWDCHDPHGDNNHLMIQNVVADTTVGTAGVPNTTRTVAAIDVATGGYTSSDLINAGGTGLCQTCHAAAGAGASYFYRGAAPPASAAHNSYDTTVCTVCHKHTADFEASCDTCHGGGTNGTVTNNYWPDASNANPENNPAGAHLAHLNDLSVRIYGVSAAALLNDAAAVAKQKHLCKYCHGTNPGADGDHGQNPASNRADVPAGGIHPLWSIADPPVGDDGAYVSATLTCTTTDCHYNRTTPGWESGTAATCTTCHFNNTVDNGALANSWPDLGTAGTGDHFAHYAALGGEFTTLYGATNTLCIPCHSTQQPATTFADIVTMASHIDGDRFGDATIASVAGAYDDKSAGVAAYGGVDADNTCTDVSCHGGITTPPWQSGTIATATVVTAECVKCHVREDGNTVPLGTEYNSARSGAHVDHDHGCEACHSASPAAHYTGIATIAMDNPTIGSISSVPWSVEYTDSTTAAVNGLTNGFFNGAATAGGVSGTCATVNCHNNQATVAWDVDLSATCAFCHLDTPTSNSHPAHVYGTPGTADLSDCNQCHPSGTYAVAASGTNANFLSPGTHANLAIDKVAGLGASGSGGTLTCTTNPCHVRETATSWNNTTAPMSCNSCHYYAASPLAGSNVGAGALGGTHNAHFFGGAAAIVCVDCHANHTADVNDKRTHMKSTGADDGAVLVNKAQATQEEGDVLASVMDVSGDPDPGNPTCTAALCHNPTPGAGYSATWNDPANNSCGFCHADTTGDPASGSHTAHIGYASGYAPCTRCHVNNGASYTHMSRAVDMAVVTYGGTLTPPYDGTSWGTCSAGACHLTVANPAWGQQQGTDITDCTACHGDGTNDTNSYDGTDGTASEIQTGLQWTTYGHGAKAGANTCGACHDITQPHEADLVAGSTNPFRLESYAGVDAFCSNTTTCHTGALSSVAISHTDEGMTADQRTWPAWNPKCVDCHDPHGDGQNLAMIQADVFDRGSSTHGVPNTPRTADTTVFTSKGEIAAGSYANSTDADGICQECHLATDGAATNMLSFLDDDPSPLAPSHPSAGLSPCTSCHQHSKAFEPAACEACHDATPYVKGSATAPNVMGDGALFGGDGSHATPQPYDDGAYGYNVNGHGRDNDTSAESHGDPIGVACTACHDISQPAGTHLDGVLNGRLTPSDTRTANSFHLVTGFIKASPSSEWDVQVTFDNYCWSAAGCHSGKTTDYRHAMDGGNDPLAVSPYVNPTDPNATQLGTHNSYSAPLPTTPDLHYDRNLKSAATFGAYDGVPNFATCVSCHNPHGTNTVSPRSDLNNKMAIFKWASPAQLCAKCH